MFTPGCAPEQKVSNGMESVTEASNIPERLY